MHDFNLVMSCIPGDHAHVKCVCSYHFVFWTERSILLVYFFLLTELKHFHDCHCILFKPEMSHSWEEFFFLTLPLN